MPSPEVDTSGPRLRTVLGGLALVVVVLGVASHWRYALSERHFADTLSEMDRRGPDLDVEGCVDAVLQWHVRCEANAPLCDRGVPQVMAHCLSARDRAEACEDLDPSSADAQWRFDTCAERRTPCRSRKRCPCADTYRAFESFCRNDQQGVAL